MARSTYIYVVFKQGLLLSAFTVKHEMVSSLPEDYDDFKEQKYEVYRIRDGYFIPPQKVDITREIENEQYV